jgi:hypothetical protein
MFGTVQMSCTYNCKCASPLIYISCIKCNVVTLYERILTCFIIYRNAITVALVSSADNFPPCLDFKLELNNVVFLGGKIIASTSLQLWVKTWLSTKLDGQPLPSCTCHTYSCMYSSFVQYQTYSCFYLVLLRCKKSRSLWRSVSIKNNKGFS